MSLKLTFNPTTIAIFKRKLVSLTATTVALIALIRFKLLLPGAIYLVALLVLHLYLLLVYAQGSPWRDWLKTPKQLIVRLLAVIFFGYLLALIKFTGQPTKIILSLMLATFIHAAILAILLFDLKLNNQ